MKRKRQALQFILAVMLTAFCAAAFAAEAQQAKPAKPSPAAKTGPGQADRTIATVNGARIYESDLRRSVEAIRTDSGDTEKSPEATLELRKSALEQLIGFELLYQNSQSLEHKDIDKQVDQMIAEGEQQFGSREKLEEQLAAEGLTLEQVRRNIKKNLMVQAEVQQRVTPQVKVSEEEIKAAYQENLERFKHEEQVGARHILVAVPKNATEEEKKAAAEKIAGLRSQLVDEGKDFVETARNYSDCPSKTKGGDLGYFSKGQMVPEFEKVVFSLKEGQISEVVETPFGYHLIQVYGRKPPGPWPLEQVRDQIERELSQKKTWDAITAHIKELQKKAKIQVLDKSLAAK